MVWLSKTKKVQLQLCLNLFPYEKVFKGNPESQIKIEKALNLPQCAWQFEEQWSTLVVVGRFTQIAPSRTSLLVSARGLLTSIHSEMKV